MKILSFDNSKIRIQDENGNTVEIAIKSDVEVKHEYVFATIEFAPYKPVEFHNTDYDFDFGQNVTLISEGLYLKYRYDRKNAQYGCSLVITQPELVGKSVGEFHPYEQAQYRLAEVVRKSTRLVMNDLWKVRVVDSLPKIVHGLTSTSANTSSVSWDGCEIASNIRLMKTDGWTGFRSSYKRTIYIQKGSGWDILE